MNTHIKTALSMFVGLVLAALFLWCAWTLHQDHKNIEGVVTFLNSQIEAAKSASAAPAAK